MNIDKLSTKEYLIDSAVEFSIQQCDDKESFVAKYKIGGVTSWTKEFPTPDGAKNEALKDLLFHKEIAMKQYDHLIQMILNDK